MAILKDLFKPLLQLLPSSGNSLNIGLDIGPDRINLVQMQRGAQHPCIRAIASLPLPCSRDELYQHPDKLKALLKQAFSTQPFKGKRVVSCLPTDQVKVITVSFQHSEAQADSVAIVAELRERLKGELDSMVVDFMTLRQEESDSTKREALVALAPRDKVMSYLKLLASADLEVDALDIGPAALTRLISHAGAIHTPEFPKLPNVLLINFGVDSSFLTIICGRRLMLDRAVEFSEKRVFSRLQQVLNMPEALAIRLLYETPAQVGGQNNASSESGQMVAEVLNSEIAVLLQEVNKTLGYMASKTRGQTVGKIYLSGRVSRYSGILTALRGQLPVPIEVLNPVDIFAAEKNQARDQDKEVGAMAGIALATGLALRGVPLHG